MSTAPAHPAPTPGVDGVDGVDGAVAERLASYRSVREQLERALLPLATSVDGASFEVQASLHGLALRRGGYVVIRAGDAEPARLGQITDLRVESERAVGDAPGLAGAEVILRLARGTGVLLETDGRSFHDAAVRPAEPGEVEAWAARTRPARAVLEVGELLRAPGVTAALDSGGLDRHTFMCGQSGSGKTYALGLLLERVLAETDLPILVLDPNSDYVRLAQLREGADPSLTERYRRRVDGIAVWGDGPSADHPLRLRFSDLQPAAQAAVLGLDPVRDLDEYAVLQDLVRHQSTGEPLVAGVEQLLEAQHAGARRLGTRAQNLGVLDWSVWDPGLPSIVNEVCEPTARCTVVDLGSLSSLTEQRVVAQAVLAALWQTRAAREPRLVVVDEAHNVCPAEPPDALTAQSTEAAVQIAAEGRKFGLYLLTATQRPHKVHENVVSQCDNLLLMRMNSRGDLVELSRIFSFVPEGLMAGATTFAMGQALVAGKILRQPAYVQMGARVSQEGGADLPTTWAQAR